MLSAPMLLWFENGIEMMYDIEERTSSAIFKWVLDHSESLISEELNCDLMM